MHQPLSHAMAAVDSLPRPLFRRSAKKSKVHIFCELGAYVLLGLKPNNANAEPLHHA